MTFVLPALTAFDPETSSEGYARSARHVLDRRSARDEAGAGSARTDATNTISDCQGDWGNADGSECEPWGVWEWLVVEALLRSPTIALSSVPDTLRYSLNWRMFGVRSWRLTRSRDVG